MKRQEESLGAITLSFPTTGAAQLASSFSAVGVIDLNNTPNLLTFSGNSLNLGTMKGVTFILTNDLVIGSVVDNNVPAVRVVDPEQFYIDPDFDRRKVKKVDTTLTMMPTTLVDLIVEYAGHKESHETKFPSKWMVDTDFQNSNLGITFVIPGQTASFTINGGHYFLQAPNEGKIVVKDFKELANISDFLEDFTEHNFELTQAAAFRLYKSLQLTCQNLIETFMEQNHMDFNKDMVEKYINTHFWEILGISHSITAESNFYKIPSTLVGEIFSFLDINDVRYIGGEELVPTEENVRYMGEIEAEPDTTE